MTQKPIIQVKGVSKKFNQSFAKPARDGFRDLFGISKDQYQRASSRFHDGAFWALQDVSFDVYKGETLGIIGANGAGKSTLLKILSQIYRPTSGSFTINGRVSSLLEVGTGFHVELSGRENVYFNGALLGMTKKEIDDKFAEIVEFAEMEEFIDTPIKYYSSGMRSKLGFSVAVNLDAEVMIIDEALAVGDARFREKALQRMKQSAFTGKTVLFVTHSLNFVEESCNRVLYLKDGQVEGAGSPKRVLEQYLSNTEGEKSSYQKTSEVANKTGFDHTIAIEEMKCVVNGETTDKLVVGYDDNLEIKLTYTTDKASKSYLLGYSLFDEQNRRLWRLDQRSGKKGQQTVTLPVDLSLLKPGSYRLAADAFIEGIKQVIQPKSTDAVVTFVLAGHRDDIINENIEGIIKPPKDSK